ncbi:MAG: ABC transporter permease [Candidatus Sericytochromatia bacterium]
MKNTIKYETNILSQRYLEIVLSDLTSIFSIFFQPIAVAFCIGLIWKDTQNTPTLHFVILFSAIFFGCINSCREIVKEKSIFERERISGLKITSYILSKLYILCILGFIQLLIFYFFIRFNIVLDGNQVLLFLSLYLSSIAGTSLGIAISAFVTTDVMALSLVPVFLIPQLLFSKLIMPNKSLSNITEIIEKSTIVKWGYDFLEQSVAKDHDYKIIFTSFFVLFFIIIILNFLSGLILKIKELK